MQSAVQVLSFSWSVQFPVPHLASAHAIEETYALLLISCWKPEMMRRGKKGWLPESQKSWFLHRSNRCWGCFFLVLFYLLDIALVKWLILLAVPACHCLCCHSLILEKKPGMCSKFVAFTITPPSTLIPTCFVCPCVHILLIWVLWGCSPLTTVIASRTLGIISRFANPLLLVCLCVPLLSLSQLKKKRKRLPM